MNRNKVIKSTVIIITAVILLIVGSGFGGAVLAGRPTGSDVLMETDSGFVPIVDPEYPNIANHRYTEAKHVHLTVHPASPGYCEKLTIWIAISRPSDYNVLDVIILTPGEYGEIYTYEFDAHGWGILAECTEKGGTNIYYCATITYPR